MGFMKANITADAVKENTSSYISKSGIYDVTLKIVSVDVNEHGARSINFNVEHDGSENTFYGLKLDNNDGSDNYQAAIFNKLMIVTGITELDDPETQTHKLGKDKVEKELEVLTEFEGVDVKVRVQEEYSKYNGEIRKRMVIRNFYRAEDGATAEEIVNAEEGKEVTFGAKLEKDRAYAENVTYKDDVTPEEVKAWKESKANGGSSTSAPQPKKGFAPKKPVFKK